MYGRACRLGLDRSAELEVEASRSSVAWQLGCLCAKGMCMCT